MPDNLTTEQRRYCMSRVKNKDTDLEVTVRSRLHKRGFRFRKHLKDIPGKPDIVFTAAKLAVFIDGNFWHGYAFDEWCHNVSPFWQAKIQKNIDRDRLVSAKLTDAGWTVLRFWKHEVKANLDDVVDRIVLTLSPHQSR